MAQNLLKIFGTVGFVAVMALVGYLVAHNPHHPDKKRDAIGGVVGALGGVVIAGLVLWGTHHRFSSKSRLLDPDAIDFMKQYSRHIPD